MNRKPSVCLNDLLNQKPPRKSKIDQIPIIPQIISEQSFSEKKKKQNISKLLTSDYSNSINKIEFARQIHDKKNQTKKYHQLRDAINIIHEEFIKSFSMKNNNKNYIFYFMQNNKKQPYLNSQDREINKKGKCKKLFQILILNHIVHGNKIKQNIKQY